MTVLLGTAIVFVLGIGAQWLAWRFRLPSILLLLLLGFLAGPVAGVLDPAMLEGDWVFPLVSISIGIILFEGGLTLRLDELREVGVAVRNLITIGVLVTWALGTVAAYYLLGFNLGMSITLGALLTVTGPTVIIPLLRHIRPTGRVGTIAKWEGITIDPIGAILAVLVLEAVVLLNETSGAEHGGELGSALSHAFRGLLLEISIGVGVAVVGAGLMILLLRRRLVPDYLQNSIALMTVIAVFALSDMLQEESGLLATTLMGIFMANQRYVSVQRIIEFKEDLRVLLISVLFILLSARLELADLMILGWSSLIFLAAMLVVVRPVSVYLSLFRTGATLREMGFLAWLAPRGIVAAAVASIFSFRLEGLYPEQATAFAPVVFLVIAGTVAIYGLTIGPLAQRLGLAQPNPQGVLLVGAHEWARRLAGVLHEQGFKVMVVDTNNANIEQARAQGLTAIRANVLSEGVIDDLNLGGIGRLLAITPNDEVNTLAALHFAKWFDSAEVYQLAARAESRPADESHHDDELPQHLRGRPLFGKGSTYQTMTRAFNSGATIETLPLTEETTLDDLREEHGDELVPLFVIRNATLLVYSDQSTLTPSTDDKLLALVPSPSFTSN